MKGLWPLVITISLGFTLNAASNPIVIGQLRIELFNEDVEITVSKGGDGKLISSVICKASMEISIPGLDLPRPKPIKLPQELIIHFPVPKNAQEIKVILVDESGEEKELEYEVIDNPYPFFKDFMIIECRTDISKPGKVEIRVSYRHELPEQGGRYRLRYAFGTGRVFTKRYENIDLLIKLPLNSNVLRYKPDDLALSADEEGVYLQLHTSGWFYLPRRNVEVIFNLNGPGEREGTSVEVPDITCKSGEFVRIKAKLTDSGGEPIPGRKIKFYTDGIYKGRARTNGKGEATLTCFVLAPADKEIEIKAVFEGDEEYGPSEGTGHLRIEKRDLPAIIIPVHPVKPAPLPIISPRIDLGKLPVGKLIRRRIKLRNLATVPLRLKLKLEGDRIDEVSFRLNGAPIELLDLPPGEEAEVEVAFKPIGRGRLIPRLTISNGSGEEISGVELMAQGVLFGDVSGDGRVTPYDAALVLEHVIGLQELPKPFMDAADVSGDGRITAYDAALILRRTAGLTDGFPVEDGEQRALR